MCKNQAKTQLTDKRYLHIYLNNIHPESIGYQYDAHADDEILVENLTEEEIILLTLKGSFIREVSTNIFSQFLLSALAGLPGRKIDWYYTNDASTSDL